MCGTMNYSSSSSFLRRAKAVIAESAISPRATPTPVEPVRGESELEAVEGAVVDVVSVVVSVVVEVGPPAPPLLPTFVVEVIVLVAVAEDSLGPPLD